VRGSSHAARAARRRHGHAAARRAPADGLQTARSGPVDYNIGHESGSGRGCGGVEGPASVRRAPVPPQLRNTITTAAVH